MGDRFATRSVPRVHTVRSAASAISTGAASRMGRSHEAVSTCPGSVLLCGMTPVQYRPVRGETGSHESSWIGRIARRERIIDLAALQTAAHAVVYSGATTKMVGPKPGCRAASRRRPTEQSCGWLPFTTLDRASAGASGLAQEVAT